jgi:hypothetical protein
LLGTALIARAASGAKDAPPVRKTEPVPRSSANTSKDEAKTPAKQSSEPTMQPGEKKAAASAPLSFETLKLPNGTVILICPDLKEALELRPKAVVLTAEEYQRLIEQLEQLKRQNKSDKPLHPSICRVTGRVAEELAQLQVQFEFRTERPSTLINLGCRKGWPIAAHLDGELAFLQESDDGYVIPVEKAGIHKAILELRLPVVSRRGARAGSRGFDLDLPGAAISLLDQLDLPNVAADVTVGARSVKPKPIDGQHSRLETVPIIPASATESGQRFEVTWKGTAAEPAKGPLVLSATGKIVVHVDEAHIATDADLDLRVVRGETAQWRVRVPLPAEAIQEAKVQPQDESRVQSIERTAEKDSALITVHLREVSAEPLRLTLRLQQAQNGKLVPVGPLAVLDALSQRGEIEIRSTDELRLYYQKQGAVGQREVSDDQRRDNVRAVFQYWNSAAQPGQPAPPWVTVQAETVKGTAEARVTHSLRLFNDEAGATPRLQVTTRLEVTPIRTAIDRLELSLPAFYEFEKQLGATPSELVEEVAVDSKTQTLHIKLAHKQFRPFAVSLPGTYLLREGTQEAAVGLPQPKKWSFERGIQTEGQPAGTVHGELLDRGGQVTITFPEGLAAVGSPGAQETGSPKLHDLLPDESTPPEYTWQAERMPLRVALAWRPHRPDLAVDTFYDITLTSHQAHVRERCYFQFAQAPPAQVLFHVPSGLLGAVRLLAGAALAPVRSNRQRDLPVVLTTPAEKQHAISLEYTFSLPQANPDARFIVPLVRVARATRGGAKIRIWTDPGDRLKVSGGQWEELPMEIVAERDSLPALVLHGGLETPLSLQRNEAGVAGLASAVIERALLHCMVSGRRLQTWHARYRLGKLAANTLDIELPGVLAGSGVEVRLDDKRVPMRFVDETGKEADVGRRVRLAIEPELYHKAVVLDIRYQADAEGQNTLFQTTLQPPLLSRAVLLGRVRWQIDLPPEELALYPSGGFTAEQRWSLWGWLLAPRPALTTQQLEQWFNENDSLAADEREPTLVCWQTVLSPLVLLHAPERFWLLVCSLVVLGLGVGLIYVRLPRLFFWACVLMLAAGIVVIGILWPGLLPSIVYGCEPGAAVLIFLVALQWTLHERYRRKVVFMPGFTRLKPGSSLVHAGSSNRKRELSTVDEPPKRGSSVSKQPKA